jgi:hypothetical protein
MGYGLYDYQRRYRRRLWGKAFKVCVFLAILAGVAGFSYLVGTERFKARQGSLAEELAEMTAAKDKAERRAIQLQQIAQTQEVRANELEIRLQRDLPSGDLARMVELSARKLSEGVSIDRLLFIVEKTSVPRSCTTPEVKRFVLPTPLYKGANTQVAFANGQVVVSGEGVPSRDAAGNPEAWYDPTKPVRLRIVVNDGEPVELSGPLPLEHVAMSQDRDVKLRISAGARSFVEVQGEVCLVR